ncbi:hypothetical protein [Salisediminibacterium beveridgei]|uniref:Uncharacterized protein n=1 Tax=Salisediminibacterium beveridgei TaxID=632773 RepID=A0A1D7QXA0_9BACI|nr:hypothetical protein [Salisediminibacterium beveridgei]AOM83630.1 hypothetical protein BBEV_2289 [Salisediminibacterium beveridgei]
MGTRNPLFVAIAMSLAALAFTACANQNDESEDTVSIEGKYAGNFSGVEMEGLIPFFVEDTLSGKHAQYDHQHGTEREAYEAEAYWLRTTDETSWYDGESGEPLSEASRGQTFDYPNHPVTVTVEDTFEPEMQQLPKHVSWAPLFLPIIDAVSITVHPYRPEDYIHYQAPQSEDKYIYWLFGDTSSYDQEFMRQYAYSLYHEEQIELNLRFISDPDNQSAKLLGVDEYPAFIIIDHNGLVASSEDQTEVEAILMERMDIELFNGINH